MTLTANHLLLERIGMALSKSNLDQIAKEGCRDPSCTATHDTIALGCPHHPRSGFDVSYSKGILSLHCRSCDSVIPVQVGDRPNQCGNHTVLEGDPRGIVN